MIGVFLIMEATETYFNQPMGESEGSNCPSEVNLAYFRGWGVGLLVDRDKRFNLILLTQTYFRKFVLLSFLIQVTFYIEQ